MHPGNESEKTKMRRNNLVFNPEEDCNFVCFKLCLYDFILRVFFLKSYQDRMMIFSSISLQKLKRVDFEF